MSATLNSSLPLLLVLLPAVFGVLILGLPKKWKLAGAVFAAVGAASTLVRSLLALGQSLEFTRAWAGWGMDFSLKLTVQNDAMVVAAAALTLVVAAYTVFSKSNAHGKVFDASMMFALTMANGALMANNLVAMLFFWQAMWAPVFGMIQAGGENSWKASVKAVFTAGFADLTMILGIGFASLSAESMTMDAMHVPATALGTAGFLLMAVGAIGKLGAIPFHGWLYQASEDAPSPFMGLIPGGLNLLMGANLLSKFSGMFDANAGAMFAVLLVGAGTVVLAGMLAMSAGGFKKLAIALNVAQGGALVLGATSVAGGAFVYAAIVAAAAGCCLYLTADALEKGKAGGPAASSLLFYVAAGAAAAVVFTGALYRIALYESWLGLIFSVVALIGAIFAASGVVGMIRAGRNASLQSEPAFDLGGAQTWLDRTRCDPYPAAASCVKAYSNVSLKVNDAISWFYDVGVVWFVGFLSSLVKRAHNGNQSRYVLWVLFGAVVVIAIFALS